MNEQFASKISAEDKKAIEDMTKETLDWMDAHQDATKEDYEANMKEVEGKIQPIFAKLYQDGAQGGMLNVVAVRGLQCVKVNYPPEDT